MTAPLPVLHKTGMLTLCEEYLSLLCLQADDEVEFLSEEHYFGCMHWAEDHHVVCKYPLGERGDLLLCAGHEGCPSLVSFTQVCVCQ